MAFVDRFVLGERVGVGATGEVFRAFDKARGILVAVKRLHEHLAADPFSRDRFHCETDLSTRIDSDHVVRCLEGGVDDDDRPYLVLEWLEGEDLAQRMKASRVSTSDAIEIARQTTLGLQAMHDAGIVHRDIKPRNLFVANAQQGKPFVVKLLDLGLAYDANTDRPEGVALGTPFYMSPEQAQASSEIGPASDLFSLGALLFELLTGQRPFAGHTTFALLAKIALQVTPRLSHVWPRAPRALESVVTRALARDPAGRFSSAREMADALEKLGQVRLDVEVPIDSTEREIVEPSPDHLVGVIFGRLPLTNQMGRMRDELGRIARAYEGTVVTLLGRGVVLLFDGECADGLLRAADAAIELAEGIVGARWSLVTGDRLAPRMGLSESIIDRGSRALERARTGQSEACVRIDDEAARLLDEHYVIEGVAGAMSLRAVR